jgi:TPR repeat protein
LRSPSRFRILARIAALTTTRTDGFMFRPILLAAMLAMLAPAPAAAQSNEGAVAAFERGDYEGAVANWRPLAEDGDPEAQINLAGMYFHGHGVERDLVAAHAWCDIAASLLPEGEARLLAIRLRGEVALRLSEDELARSAARAARWHEQAETGR